MSKGRLAANRREHAPYGWGEIRFVNVELHIGWELSLVACGAQVVGAIDLCPPHRGEDWPATHSFIMGRPPTRAGDAAMVLLRWRKAKQFRNGVRTGLVDGGTNRYLYRLQVQLAGLVAVGEDALQLVFYLAGGFFADRGCRFFS